MKLPSASLVLLASTLFIVSCSTEERDGRQYHSGSTPVQSRMGVQYKRLRSDTPAAPRIDDGSLFGARSSDEPPGLLDRNQKPDEPGAEYWVHGQHSPNPVQGRMGVRVTRRKK